MGGPLAWAIMRSVRWAAGADIGCVLLFVVIGRASHSKGETLAGLASTSWPFLGGLAAGWLAGRAWRQPAALVPSGVAAWLGAVAVGMVLRVIAGQGTAFAFILVALAFLGLFLLGWRLAARLVTRFRTPSRPHGGPLIQEDAVSTRPPLPPFSDETARQKVQAAEDARAGDWRIFGSRPESGREELPLR